MTKQKAIANHRKMWRWIADETERREYAVDKSDYFDIMGIPEVNIPLQNCYCCEYDGNVGDGDCASCPIKWPTGVCYDGGLYSQWAKALSHNRRDWLTTAALARQIAELPEKEDVK